MNEQLSFFSSVYEVPEPGANYVLGAVLAVAVVVVPWSLIGWLIWTLT
jgi:hypothetical protein